MEKLVFLIALLTSLPVCAKDYAVVVSAGTGIGEMEAIMIRDVFLKKRQFANKLRLLPLNITGDSPARRAFEESVLHMNRNELNRYWIEHHFQGVSPPGTQASFDALKAVIQRVEGSITYLPITMVDERMEIIHEF